MLLRTVPALAARLPRALPPFARLALALVALPGLSAPAGAAPPVLTPLHVFSPAPSNANAGGASPQSSLLDGGDGYLYGTTRAGGTSGSGVVFRAHADGTGYQDLHDFGPTPRNVNADGASPQAALIAPGDGFLYGTARTGGPSGTGTVYKLKTDGTGFAVVHAFSAKASGVNADGIGPQAALVAPGDGFLYGTAEGGGTSGTGTVFKVKADGTGFMDLHDFSAQTNNVGGANPNTALVVLGDGFLYGTTFGGGTSGYGTVFRLATDGTGFTDLHDFAAASGSNPINVGGSTPNGLVAPGDGFLYGTTYYGGPNGGGVVFRLATDGTGFTDLHDFNGNGNEPQAALVVLGDGFLYGTTRGTGGQGAVFRLKTDGTGYQELHDFSALNASFENAEGADPQASLIALADGLLYGTATQGGANATGTVFRLATDGTGFTDLHDFAATVSGQNADGVNSQSTLVAPGDGFLYGTTFGGGASGTGAVFKVRFGGTGFTVLHAFSALTSAGNYENADGALPYAGLAVGGDGYLYGTAVEGGAHGDGTVFRVKPDGTGFQDLHDFAARTNVDTNAEGIDPEAALVVPGDGFVYGTAYSGGGNGTGTVFRLRLDGSGFTDLHDFAGLSNGVNADGANPQASLIAPGDGFLYGTAYEGGAAGQGTVFRLATDGSGFTDLHDFAARNSSNDNAEGAIPLASLVAPGDGYLYGTAADGGASGQGTVFRLKTDGTGFQDLHDFSALTGSANADGSLPEASLVVGGDGFLYGTTHGGGPSGAGVVFRLHPDGTGFETYYAFNQTDADEPEAGLLVLGDGFLYGTARTSGAGNAGSVFQLTGPPVSHVLWTNPDGKTIFWDVNADGSHTVAGTYGPFADNASSQTDYTALSLSTGPDGVSHLLWGSPDGRTYLWTVQADGSFTPFYYGLFEDDGTANTIWQPVAVSTGGDNVSHVLWTNPDGRTILWDVDAATGAFTIIGNYDPQPGYTPVALASGPDGLSHILWNGADGTTLLWDVDTSGTPTPHFYGPFSDDGTNSTLWTARAVSVGPDGAAHILWNNPNGHTILWDVSPTDGTFTIPGNYGAFADDASGTSTYTAVALATGNDGLSHFAWDNPDGNSYLWSVNDTDGSHLDTFFPPFLDDGTSSTIWKAVAVSAAVSLPPI